MHYLIIATPLFLLYLLLTGNWEISNLVVGLVIAATIPIFIRPKRRPVSWQRIPGSLLAAVRYVVILLLDLIRSGLQVTGIVLSPSLAIRPGIVAIPSGCQSELSIALSAHAITVTPGEMVVEIDEDGVMYTHVLDTDKAEAYADRAQEMRRQLLAQIFE